MDMPLTTFLWTTESRTNLWYPHTWLTMPNLPNSTELVAVHLGREVTIATASKPGAQWERVVEDAEMHVCTHPPESSGDISEEADNENVWAEFEDQPCSSAEDGEWTLEVFLGTCKELQTDAEASAIAKLSSVSSFHTAWEQEATLSRVVSAVSAGLGGVTNAGVSAAISQVAASAGEIGQAVLSGGGGVGLAPVLDGLQTLGITARLPVRHARLVYSLASGVSWCVSCHSANLFGI